MVLSDPAADLLRLGFGVGVERGAVLRAHVVSLPEALRRVVRLQRGAHEILQANPRGVVDHFDQFHVVRLPRAHFAVRRVGRHPAAVAHRRGLHTGGFPEHFLRPPEASQPHEQAFVPLVPRPRNRRPQHSVGRGVRQNRLRAARQGVMLIDEFRTTTKREEHTCLTDW